MLSKSKSILALTAVAALAFSAMQLQAATPIMNITFENDTPGYAPATTYLTGMPNPTVPSQQQPLPITEPFTISGSVTVVENGGVKSVNMVADPTRTAITHLDTAWAVPAPILNLAFDLNIGSASHIASEYASSYPLATNPSTYVAPVTGVTIRDNDWSVGTNVLLRFVAAATTETGGVFGIRVPTASGFEIITFGEYENGQDYNIALNANFTTGELGILVNGKKATLDTPYSVSDFGFDLYTTYFYVNGSDSATPNSIFLGGIRAYTDVPEPASLSILGFAAGALLLRRRKH